MPLANFMLLVCAFNCASFVRGVPQDNSRGANRDKICDVTVSPPILQFINHALLGLGSPLSSLPGEWLVGACNMYMSNNVLGPGANSELDG